MGTPDLLSTWGKAFRKAPWAVALVSVVLIVTAYLHVNRDSVTAGQLRAHAATEHLSTKAALKRLGEKMDALKATQDEVRVDVKELLKGSR